MIEIDSWFAFERSLIPRKSALARVALSGAIAVTPLLLAQTVIETTRPSSQPVTWTEPDLPDSATTGPVYTQASQETPPEVQPVANPPPSLIDLPISSEAVEAVNVNLDERKWRLFASADLHGTYDDNIFINDLRKESDFYFTIAPSVSFGWGDYRQHVKQGSETDRRFEITPEELGAEKNNFVFARYTPSWLVFLDHTGLNVLNHDLYFDSQWQLSRLTLGLHSEFQSIDEANVDIGNRVHREEFQIGLNASYWLSDKTSIEVNLNDRNTTYENRLGSNEFVDENWFNYQWMPKTTLSIGTTLGYLSVEQSPGQFYEQGLLRATYFPSGKLSMRVSGGVEFRQSSGSKDSSNAEGVSGVFGIGATYVPFEGTEIGLDAYRRVQNSSLFPGDNYTATSVALRVKQKVFQRLSLVGFAGFTNSVYGDAPGGQFPKRTDNFFYSQLGLSFDFTKWSTIELSYQFRQNDSTVQSVNFEQNIADVHVNILF